MNVPMNAALDKMLERFLSNTGVRDPIINEELVLEAFYEGARIACLVTVLQEAESEEVFGRLLNEGMSTVEELTEIMQEAFFEESNVGEGDC